MVPDQFAALDVLIELGYTRVLTSGGAPTVPEGLDRLRDLVRHAAGRIEIQAGGGVTPESIGAIRAAGVDAIHLSGKTLVAASGGPGGGGQNPVERTDRAIVRAAVLAAR